MTINNISMLEQEIEWWTEELSCQPKDTKVYLKLLAVTDSFLCSSYNDKVLIDCSDCFDCPVYDYTGYQYCENTAYMDIVQLHSNLLTLQDAVLEETDKKLKKILIKELDKAELQLYQRCCDYLRFLKDDVLPNTIKKDSIK